MVQRVKNLPAIQETQVRSLGLEDPLEKGMATHSSILAGEFRGQRKEPSGCSLWAHKKLDTSERPIHTSETKTLSARSSLCCWPAFLSSVSHKLQFHAADGNSPRG